MIADCELCELHEQIPVWMNMLEKLRRVKYAQKSMLGGKLVRNEFQMCNLSRMNLGSMDK